MCKRRIVVIEANAIFREGLLRILSAAGYESCIGLSSIDEADNLEVTKSKVLLLANLGIDERTIESGVATLRARYPDPWIVILSDLYSHSSLVAAFRAGAQGYLQKSISCEALVRSLDLAALGQPVIPGDALYHLVGPDRCEEVVDLRQQEHPDFLMKLSFRELEVLNCLSAGSANKVIARRCGITEATVKVHVKAILRKLKAKNRTEAAILARSCAVQSTVRCDA